MSALKPQEKALAAAFGLVSAIAAVAVIAVPLFIHRSQAPRDLALDSAGSPAGLSAVGGPGTGAEESQKSISGTESAEATGTSAKNAGSKSSAAGSNGATSTSPPVPGGGGGGPSGGDGGAGPGPTPAQNGSLVTGRIVHAVWGTPLADIAVYVTPSGRSARTDALGFFAFSDVPADTSTRVSVVTEGQWLSHSALALEFVTAPHASHRADFALYATSEASGRDWRSASSWRDTSEGDLAAAMLRVRSASSAFAVLSTSEARSVLGASKNGSPKQRARAELLATWLDLATARLGFDTPVDPSGGYFSSARTALSLTRAADAMVAGEGDADWNAIRRVLSERSLAGGTASQQAGDEPSGDTGSKARKK